VSEPFVSRFEVEAPFAHSTGAAMGRWLGELRARRIMGRRCSSCGLVVVPAYEHCDSCGGELGEWRAIGPGGTVRAVTATQGRTLAAVRLDGADVDLIHVVEAGVERGARVRPKWTREPAGAITDVERFERGEPADDDDAPGPAEPVAFVRAHLRLPFDLSAGALASRFFDGIRDGRIHGNRCPSCARVYVPPRGSCSACWVECRDWIEVSDHGVLETFVIVNVPFYGQQVEIPYVLGSIRLDGADSAFLHLVAGPRRPAIGLRVRAVWREERTGFLSEDVDRFEAE